MTARTGERAISASVESDDVDRPLGHGVPAQDRDVLEPDQRDPADGVHVDPAQAHLVQVRHQLEADLPLAAVIDDPQDRGVRRRRQRHDHLVDPLLAGQPLDVVEAAQVAEPPEVAGPVVVHEADDLVPQVGSGGQALHDDPAEVVAADYQHPLHADAPLVQQRRDELDQRPPRHHEHGRQHPGQDERQARRGRVAKQRDAGEDRHRRQRRAPDHARDVVEPLRAPPLAVEPAHRKRQKRDRDQPDQQRREDRKRDVVDLLDLRPDLGDVADRPAREQRQGDQHGVGDQQDGGQHPVASAARRALRALRGTGLERDGDRGLPPGSTTVIALLTASRGGADLSSRSENLAVHLHRLRRHLAPGER